MNFKKIIALCLVALLVLSLAACSKQETAPAPGPAEEKKAEPAKTYNIKFGHNQDTNSPQHRGIEAFKKKVEELSNGQVKVTIYPNMQLGQMREQAEQAANGTIEMTQQPTSVLSNFNQALEVYDLPFLYKNMDAAEKVMFGPVAEKINKGLEEKGMVALGVETGGLKQMTANFPIKGPESLKGKKFRVMPAPILIETYKAFGANPTPIEYGEMYNALQQKVVDGQENGFQTLVMLKLWEVQKVVSVTNHSPFLYITVANKAWFEGLPADIQKHIRDAAQFASKSEWAEMKANSDTWLEELKKNNMEVYYPTEEEMNAFKAASKPVAEFISSRVGADVVAELQKAAEEANK
ncbi:MAG: TRAP transporter substrate-binding protein [Bacillota bacterium]